MEDGPPEPPHPDWADEQRMAFLFSAFKQSRDVDSADWDGKLAFWAPLVLQAAARRRRIRFTPRELGGWFQRNGAAPLGLATVLQHLARRGVIQTESSFAASVDTGWLARGVWLLLVKPLRWTLASILGTDTISPDDSFIIVDHIKDKAAEVLRLCQRSLDAAHPVAVLSALQQECREVCEDEKTFCLCLVQLQKDKKVAVAELDGERIVKLAHPGSNKPAVVTEVDVGVYHLMNCEKMLSHKAETLSQEADGYQEEARKQIRAGKKHLALKSLKMKKRTFKQLEDIHAKLDTIDTILDRIRSSQTDLKVVEAYQAGLGALRQSMKDVSVEKVENLMDEIEQFCDTQDDIRKTLAGESFDVAGGADVSDLEAELDALLQEELQLPDVPADTRPAASFSEDNQLLAKLSKLSLTDQGPIVESRKPAASLELAQ